MSRILYSYRCKQCGDHFTGWNKVSERYTHKCGQCGALADLFINGVRFELDPVSGDFPSATDKWAKAHEKANLDDLQSLGLRETTKRFFL
jgi:putative FmdB family regulatory protein